MHCLRGPRYTLIGMSQPLRKRRAAETRTAYVAAANTMPASEARERFSDLMTSVGIKGERLVLQRHGKNLVAMIPVEDLELLEALEDHMDVSAAKAALKERGSIPWAKVKAKLGI